CMALSSPDGEALLEAPAAAVSAWLERTLRVVPPGSEQDHLGLDKGLSALLTMTPRDDRWPSDQSPEAGG
ncbi:SsgA family sporulation/cell division regulator, partial [Streptomyces chrestomyceticus]|uniref:SsgA family sporulation/cell division regulator n=1 Tax=Streptomyces chrestomyceticus TaxID=68185 RepID=UPI0033C8AAD9